MPLDLNTVGAVTQPYLHRYDWRHQASYALGIGAKRAELDYLYENTPGGIRVYPTYAVVPAFEPVFELLTRANANLAMVVHGAQRVVAHRAAPPTGELSTVATLRGIYDMRRFAQVIVHTATSHHGEALFETEWAIIVRDAGRFGGPRPPKDPDAVKLPKDRQPDFTFEETTSPEQALLYRISGDTNPLHADPTFAARVGFEQGPILHGLCTYGHMARAVILSQLGGDGSRLKCLFAQFRKPVWPGDTLITRGYLVEANKLALVVDVKERPDAVVTHAWAQFAPCVAQT